MESLRGVNSLVNILRKKDERGDLRNVRKSKRGKGKKKRGPGEFGLQDGGGTERENKQRVEGCTRITEKIKPPMKESVRSTERGKCQRSHQKNKSRFKRSVDRLAKKMSWKGKYGGQCDQRGGVQISR